VTSVEKKNIFAKLPGALLPWYDESHRVLPWRGEKDPYRIWLSEIMLQQTRVEAVKGYYARFLEAVPTVEALANADDELLHKLWQGLGYYSRVRNLKKAAQQIMEHHNGVFPRKYEDVLALAGIGGYTAGAICSIAFDQPTPAVDGNVLRVAARLWNDPIPIDKLKPAVQAALAKIYPARAGDFTQALMELGATVCGPNRKPDCESCPCKDFCLGHKQGTAESLPVRTPKKERKIEEKTVFILSCSGSYALQKRPDRGLLAGLWQFPNVSGKLDMAEAVGKVEQMSLKTDEIIKQVERKHIFTHIEWHMRGIYVEVREKTGEFTWLTAEEINRSAALPTAFYQFWEETEDV
jgi:A/G-specific adenine glycosylase